MDSVTSLTKFKAPYSGGQEIELQHVEYESGGIPVMRIRIRERGARFTVFDIDPVTARQWGQSMLDWASRQKVE